MALSEEQKKELLEMSAHFEDAEIVGYVEALIAEREREAVEQCIKVCREDIDIFDDAEEEFVRTETLEKLRQLHSEDKLTEKQNE